MSVTQKSRFFSLIFTCFIWLVMFIVFLFVKPKTNEPKFKEIQIVLDSVKKIEKKENLTTAKKQELSKNSENNVQTQKKEPDVKQQVEQKTNSAAKQKTSDTVEKKVEATQQKNVAKKTVESKSKPAAKVSEKKVETKKKTVPNPAKTVAKSEPVKYAKSVEDLMEEQFTQKKEVDDFDWDSMFADDNFESSSATSTKKITTKNTVKGTAGTTTDSSNNSVVSSNTKSTLTSKVSDSTSGKLGKISNSEFVGKASISEVTNVESTIGSNGKVSVKMANGQSRVLINPAEPKIYISEAASKLIEGSVTVTIKFTVLESGNVPSQEITITPASLLPSVVRNEIVSQLSQWRFEADEFAAIATLEFSIIKK